jgi:hypothetical protein
MFKRTTKWWLSNDGHEVVERKDYPEIKINEPDLNAQVDEFPNNYISTTKYTLWNFLPVTKSEFILIIVV